MLESINDGANSHEHSKGWEQREHILEPVGHWTRGAAWEG